jgi:ketosteroid isomerase-like protein
MSHVPVVQQIYAAFGRGDTPAILEKLSDSVEWEYGLAPNPVPWLQPRKGRAGAAEFLESLGALEFHKFVPKVFLETPGLVVVLIDLEVTVKATGKRIVEEDEGHIWHFDRAGKVVRFRHLVDSYQHAMAHQGEA